MNKISAIVQREWLEFKQDWTLILSTVMPPLLLTLLPIGIIFMMRSMPDDDAAELGMAIVDPTLAGMRAEELGQVLVGKQFGILFMILPLLIPIIIAAHSIVGEKTKRTLEPILATPISIWELLLAKSLIALLPTIGITWLCAGIFSAGVALVSLNHRVFTAIISPSWILLVVLCAPFLALIAIAGAIMISSRVNDPRTAQQFSAVVIMPILALSFSQLFGILLITPRFVIGAAVGLALLAAAAIWLATRIFQREAILTHWS